MLFLKLPLKILHLEDNFLEAEIIKGILLKEGLKFEICRVDNRDDFMLSIENGHFDIILSDYLLPSFDGMSALELVMEKCPSTPFLFVSGKIGEHLIVEAIKKGAKDYVLKNCLSDLLPRINMVLQKIEEQKGETEEKDGLSCSLLRTFDSFSTYVDRLSEFIDFQTDLLKFSGNKEIIEKVKEKRENLEIDNILEYIRDIIVRDDINRLC
ncbi:MAG: response regulator [Candidatus Eremiobacterota bacterium]